MIQAASSAVASEPIINTDCDLLSVQVEGTFTSGKIEIQGKTDEREDADWENLAVLDKSSLDLISGFTGITAKGIYETGISGLVLVRVNVASVSGGNVTVIASFENTNED